MRKKFFFIFLSVLFFARCKKDPSLWEVQNLNENKITVLGHGGMGVHYRFPMNSYESLQKCLSSGTDGTEMDVSVTKDSVLVLYHNQTLEEETTCDGRIKEKTWDEIKACSYQLPYFDKSELISAEHFFDGIHDLKKYTFTFDCKVVLEDNFEYLNLFASALIRHIEKYDLSEHCLIESFNGSFLEILHSKKKDLRLCLYASSYASGFEVSKLIPLYGLTLDAAKISADEIKQAHTHNLHVTLFNVRTEHENLDAIKKNPDCIQTDKVEFLVNALRE